MRVVNNLSEPEKVRFEQITRGQVFFMLGGTWFMKTDEIKSDLGTKYNAVQLGSGYLAAFKSGEPVFIPKDAYLHVDVV